jgi:hypothetical protein
MTTSRIVEATIVVALFLAYLVLWRIHRMCDIRQNGIDPKVLTRVSTPVQAYFAHLVWFMTASVVAIIVTRYVEA